MDLYMIFLNVCSAALIAVVGILTLISEMRCAKKASISDELKTSVGFAKVFGNLKPKEFPQFEHAIRNKVIYVQWRGNIK